MAIVPTYVIRKMTEKEIPDVLRVLKDVGMSEDAWTLSEEIIRCWYRVDPEGFYVAVAENGEILGNCSAVQQNENLKFIGIYAVRPNYQKQGIGTSIWKMMLNDLKSRNAALNSVPYQLENYKTRGGFPVDPQWSSTYWFSSILRIKNFSNQTSYVSVRKVEHKDLPDIVAYDARIVGFTRKKIVSTILWHKQSYAVVARNQHNCQFPALNVCERNTSNLENYNPRQGFNFDIANSKKGCRNSESGNCIDSMTNKEENVNRNAEGQTVMDYSTTKDNGSEIEEIYSLKDHDVTGNHISEDYSIEVGCIVQDEDIIMNEDCRKYKKDHDNHNVYDKVNNVKEDSKMNNKCEFGNIDLNPDSTLKVEVTKDSISQNSFASSTSYTSSSTKSESEKSYTHQYKPDAPITDNAVCGYACIKANLDGSAVICPLYADTPELAELLISELVGHFPAAAKEGVCLVISEKNRNAVELARKLNFNPHLSMPRLWKAAEVEVDYGRIYGQYSLDFSVC